MSAAEKLKALGTRFAPDPSEEWTAYELDDHVTALAALRNALSQIVAVVEAAERTCDSGLLVGTSWRGEPRSQPQRDVTAVLAALDEALGDVT